jgi:hypothetical protein
MGRKIVEFLVLFFAATTMAGGSEPTNRPSSCIPASSCGCSILLSGDSCPGGGAHLFHELADGSPLQFNIGQGPATAISTQARTSIFTPGPGDSWVETYRYGDGTIEVHYAPGANSCAKLAQGEQCEYFDVDVRVLIPGPDGTRTYSGAGTCGC